VAELVVRGASAYDITMTESDEFRCPTCGTTDLIVIDTRAIADEILECRACMRLYRVEHASDGTMWLIRV